MKCKYCGAEVGNYYSELEEHLWMKHRGVMTTFLDKQRRRPVTKIPPKKVKMRSSSRTGTE